MSVNKYKFFFNFNTTFATRNNLDNNGERGKKRKNA